MLLKFPGRDILVNEFHRCQFLLLSPTPKFITIIILVTTMVVMVMTVVADIREC